VDHEVGTGDELDVPGVGPVARHVTARAERMIERLVVGHVAHDRSVALDPVAQRERRMVQVLRAHDDVGDLERAFDQLVVVHAGAELVQRHREVGIGHLPRERLVQGLAHTTRSIHVPVPGAEQGLEEGQPLDVVPVGVSEHQRAADRAAVRGLDE
jgi:hypothetical protein